MKVGSNYRPIVVLPCIMSKSSISFLDAIQEIRITGEWAKIIKKILRFCNGNCSVSDIAKITGIAENTIIEIINTLELYNAILDSREQYKHFHRISNYPTTFSRMLTQKEIASYRCSPTERCAQGESWKGRVLPLSINELLKKRKTCRSYLSRPMTIDQIQSLCVSGYGMVGSNGRRSVSSGGGLYPLKIYVIVNKDQIALPAGYYEYDPLSDCLLRYCITVDTEQLKYCFNSEDFYGSSVQIVIAGNLDRQGYKYANRSYRLCLIEVGHVVENITLSAIELGLGICEFGGLIDDATRDELNMPENYVPLLAMTVGYQDSDQYQEVHDYNCFVEENVGGDKPVKSVHVWCDGGAFYTATAEYLDNGESCVGGATARSDIFAQYKAVIEAYERCESFTGENHVRMKNSCGIAANFSEKEAGKAALAELIERDAIMNCWNSKSAPDVIIEPEEHIKRRSLFWKSQGRKVTVLLLKSYAPVVLVTIVGERYPYFVCGAASSVGRTGEQNDEFENLQNKALLEAESNLMYYIKHPESGKPPKPENVHTPEDHGRFYRMNKQVLEQIEWLTSGKPNTRSVEWRYSFEELMEMLHVKLITLNRLKNGLIVVKASSADLTEMDFGVDKAIAQYPHFFA